MKKQKRGMAPIVNASRKILRNLSGALPRETDPKSQIIHSKTPMIVARFGNFLWLSEDLVFFYFEK
jgi:hypothetical protein